MAVPAASQLPISLQLLANYRWFIRWLTSVKVVLAAVMLALMTYLVLVPLYRMLTSDDYVSGQGRPPYSGCRGGSVHRLPLATGC